MSGEAEKKSARGGAARAEDCRGGRAAVVPSALGDGSSYGGGLKHDASRKAKGSSRSKVLTARRVTLSLVFVAVVASLAFDCGLGTPSTFGVGQFFLLCPLGGLEAMIADRSFIPVAALSMAVVCVLALLFGRAWCAWGCPAPVIRRFFKRDPQPAQPSGGHSCAAVAQARTLAGSVRHIGRDTRTWALVVVLVATFVAGLPLFCLVCPIGLTFGSVASLWHLFVDKQVTASVVVFPAALAVELVLYRKWCMNLCPIAGLLGIFGQFAMLFRPKVSAGSCLACAGKHCAECVKACPEHIDLHAADTAVQLGECTRCGECVRACPTKSISMK